MAGGHGEKLSRKHEQAIAALLEQSTLVLAAADVGISVRTLRDWMKLPRFLSAYRAARRRCLEQSIGRLQLATSEATDTLRRLLTCGNPAAERSAADTILSHAADGLEKIDLLERLAEIEAKLKERQP